MKTFDEFVRPSDDNLVNEAEFIGAYDAMSADGNLVIKTKVNKRKLELLIIDKTNKSKQKIIIDSQIARKLKTILDSYTEIF